MKTLFVGINLFLTLLAGIANKEEATPLTVAQRTAEVYIQQELEDCEDFDSLPEEITFNYNITWLDQDTGIIEYIWTADEDSFGLDIIFDIDRDGQIDDYDEFRYYINEESYISYNDDIWEDNLGILVPEFTEWLNS